MWMWSQRRASRRGTELEADLRRQRPEARADFVQDLSRRLLAQRPGSRPARSRLVFAGAVSVLMLGTFAAFGGLGYAASGAKSTYSVVKKAVVEHEVTLSVKNSSAKDQYPENGTLTPGYWKNHQTQTTALLSITLGGYSVSTFAQVTAVFDGMNCSSKSLQNAIGCLGGHLLAAKLNVKNGTSTCIAPTIAQADAFLSGIGYTGPSGTYTLTAAQRALAIQLKDALDKYNNGGGC
jgi:hypothetical protein